MKKLIKKLLKHYTTIKSSLPRESRGLSTASIVIKPVEVEITPNLTLALFAPSMGEEKPDWESDSRTIVTLYRPEMGSDSLACLD